MSKVMIVSFPYTKIPSLDEIVELKKTIMPTALRAINDIDSNSIGKYQDFFQGEKLIFLSTKIDEKMATRIFLSDHNGKTVKLENKNEDPFSYLNENGKNLDVKEISPQLTSPAPIPDLTF